MAKATSWSFHFLCAAASAAVACCGLHLWLSRGANAAHAGNVRQNPQEQGSSHDNPDALLFLLPLDCVDQEDADDALRASLDAISAGEAEHCLDSLALDSPRTGRHYYLAIAVFQKFSQLDPARALDWARRRGFPWGVEAYVETTVRKVFATDPARALDLVSKFPGSQLRDEALRAGVLPLAATNPEAAWQLLSKIMEPFRYSAVANELDPKVALNLIRDRSFPGKADVLFRIAGHAGKAGSPADALRIIDEFHLGADLKNAFLGKIARSNGGKSPDSVMKLVNDLPPGPGSAAVKAELMSSVWKSDPKLAWAHVEALPSGLERENLQACLIANEGSKNPGQFWSLLSGIPSATRQADVVGGVVVRLLEKDPALAAQLAEAAPTQELRICAGTELGRQWAWRRPTEVLAYLQAHPDSPAGAALAQGAGGSLFESNFNRTLAAVGAAPPQVRIAAAESALQRRDYFSEEQIDRLKELARTDFSPPAPPGVPKR